MLISFYYFQLILATAMIAGLLLLLLPLLRILKHARLPLISGLLVLVPFLNVAWFFFVTTYFKIANDRNEET